MQTLTTVGQLREQVAQWKRRGGSIGFVPTMGNLHAGHLALVERAQQHADKVIVSIFVNPMQFGPDEDYEAYPRTLDADVAALDSYAVDGLFAPSVDSMCGGIKAAAVVSVPALNHMLCGASRPDHFDGVATIVSKLFNLVRPDVAVFGQKDYQQLVLIRALASGLAFPVKIIGHPTQREPDGLAISSRNAYMSNEQRQLAPQIYAALGQLRDEVKKDAQNMQKYVERMVCTLARAGFEVEYVDIRRQNDLKIPEQDDKLLVILVAVKLGKTRLIDNLPFELEWPS